ncbi:MAG: hypothetical protein V4772_04570, partial [Pseudomonadota bacterium]
KPGATSGFDPYLVWAEASQFAGFADHSPKWLTLVIELTAGTSVAQLEAAASPKWLHIPPVYTSDAAPVGLSFCTARVKPDFFQHIGPGKSLETLIKRFELGMPLGADTDEAGEKEIATHAPPGQKLTGKVLGLIDNGLAFANANFLTKGGKARTAYYWRQDRSAKGTTPAAMGYGHELKAAEIDLALQQFTFNGLVDEDAVYRHFNMGLPLQKSVNHGTHVMDLAGGPRTLQAQVAGPDSPPSWAFAHDDASKAPIVAVQLDFDTVKDPSGGSVNAQVLDGLMYILSRCDADAKLVVNASWGTLAGPHDGSSVLEAAMDQLIELKTGQLKIVLPAGNGYQSRAHANKTLLEDEHITLNWRSQPDDLTQNFLEIWIEQGCDGLELEITPPGQATLEPLKFGESGMWVNAAGDPLLALIYPTEVATGRNGTCALLALAPTFSFKKKVATAPSGAWKVKLTNSKTAEVTFDAYIERDDDIADLNTGARQSFFEDEFYDTSGNPGSFVDHPDNPTPIRRSGSFNSIATGSKTLTAGGTRLSDGSWALYSPQKPDPDHARQQRPGVVKMPDTQSASDENVALTGVRAAGTRSSAVVRLRGTSDAAPQQSRVLLNGM